MNIDKLIEKGEDALKKKNFDYAISIFFEAVSFMPNDRRAREGLRQAELKRYAAGYPSALLIALTTLGARLGMFFAGLSRKKNPEGFMLACEKYLIRDPKSRRVNVLLGDAAAEANHVDAAIFAYETAAEQNPNDVSALKKLGRLLWRKGEIHRAHDVMSKVVDLAPHDQDALKDRKNLAAETSLRETGFETAKSSLDLVKDKQALAKLEAERRMYRTEGDLASERARLEEKLKADPGNVDALLNLAGALQKMKDYAGALAALDRAIEKQPSDTQMQFQRGDLLIEKLEEEARALLRAGKTEEQKQKLAEVLAIKTEEFGRRVKAYPTDLTLRFKYGEMLFESGKVAEAIGQFQHTVRDPKYKTQSQLRLGRAFALQGQHDLAVRQFEQALEGQSGMTEMVKQIHYELGDIHQRAGNAVKAREEFGRIYEVDIQYRDVAQRLKDLAKG